MNCLRLDQLHLYVENEMDALSASEVERHLGECPKCREAYEDRKALSEAARGLADLEVPSGFAQKIMARLFPSSSSWFGWLAAFLAGLSALFLSGMAYVVSTGQSLTGLVIGVHRSAWSLAQNISLVVLKSLTLFVLVVKHIPRFVGELAECLGRLSSLIRPEIYVLCLLSILALATLFIAVLKKKNLLGEKP